MNIPIYLYMNAHNMLGNCKINWIYKYIKKIFIHALFNFLEIAYMAHIR